MLKISGRVLKIDARPYKGKGEDAQGGTVYTVAISSGDEFNGAHRVTVFNEDIKAFREGAEVTFPVRVGVNNGYLNIVCLSVPLVNEY